MTIYTLNPYTGDLHGWEIEVIAQIKSVDGNGKVIVLEDAKAIIQSMWGGLKLVRLYENSIAEARTYNICAFEGIFIPAGDSSEEQMHAINTYLGDRDSDFGLESLDELERPCLLGVGRLSNEDRTYRVGMILAMLASLKSVAVASR